MIVTGLIDEVLLSHCHRCPPPVPLISRQHSIPLLLLHRQSNCKLYPHINEIQLNGITHLTNKLLIVYVTCHIRGKTQNRMFPGGNVWSKLSSPMITTTPGSCTPTVRRGGSDITAVSASTRGFALDRIQKIGDLLLPGFIHLHQWPLHRCWKMYDYWHYSFLVKT